MRIAGVMEIVGERRQRQALAAIHAGLMPGGRFVCTRHNPPVRRREVDGVLRGIGRFPLGEDALVVSGFEQGGHPLVTRQQFFEVYDADGVLRSKRAMTMTFELIEPRRFEQLAGEAGFTITDVFGDYDRGPFDAKASPVAIFIAHKGRAPAAKMAR